MFSRAHLAKKLLHTSTTPAVVIFQSPSPPLSCTTPTAPTPRRRLPRLAMLSTMSKAYGAARLAHMRTQNFVMPRKQPAPSQATPATPTVRIAARKQAPARLFPPRDTPRSPTRQSSQPAPHPARLRVNTAPSATRFLLHRKRFPRRDTVGMRARSRPLRLVKMPVSRPTPARSATRPKPKQSMLPVILPLKFPRSPQPAPRLVIKPAKNARSAARLSPAWRKFPQRDTNGMRARSRPNRPAKTRA